MDVRGIAGRSRTCYCVGAVIISTDRGYSIKVSVLVVRGKSLAIDLLLGIDEIKTLDGVVDR